MFERFRRGAVGVLAGGRVRCFACRQECDARDTAMDHLARLEGASDPADSVAVVGLKCPHCGVIGTVVLNYGPGGAAEECDVLVALDDARPMPKA